MDTCCTGKSSELDKLRRHQTWTLRFVLAINVAMFFVEAAAGLLAHSLALLADSLDMLTDSLVYAFSLYVVHRSVEWKARAALAKAGVMGLSGAFVVAQLVYKLVNPQVPTAAVMGAVGALALLANGACFVALWRHRAQDVNMRSVWLCSRNDLLANVLVLLAAGAVSVTSSPWPDIVVGVIIAFVFLRSAIAVAKEARAAVRTSHDGSVYE